MHAFTPRPGQRDLIKYLPNISLGGTLSVQWPTGYGKSIGFALTWKHCAEQQIANRLLMVVANDTQRRQIINDFAADCRVAGAPVAGGIWPFDRTGTDLATAKRGDAVVFVCTVQQLEASNRGGVNTIADMLRLPGTSWMLGFDEYHHYGEDMPWGDAAKMAMRYSSFTLAMSATPYRRGADTIFPAPELVVTYNQALNQAAVKPMICHSYDYAVTVITESGEAVNYTTAELMDEARNDIMRWEERKGIRYSAQYIQPMITHAVTRLSNKRAAHPGVGLQMLVRAMSCSHAKMLCDQIKVFSCGMSVDWIGTGFSGRSDEENRAAIDRFCPRKVDGRRPKPDLDILVQVSMAGEGFDSVNVSEIIDLFPVSAKAIGGRATQDKQFYGRGARVIPAAPSVEVHVNVPTDHPLHRFAGRTLHAWMDAIDELPEPGEQVEPTDRAIDLFQWPDVPKQREIELIHVITDSPHFQMFAKQMIKEFGGSLERQSDVEKIKACYCGVAQIVAKEDAAKNRMAELLDFIDQSIGRLAYRSAKYTEEVSGAVVGRFKKEYNKKVISFIGKARGEYTLDDAERAAQYVRTMIVTRTGEKL